MAACQIARKTSRETIAGPGRIVDVLKRVGGATEELPVAEEQASMLSLLDGDRRGPHLADAAPCLDQAGLTGQFACLAVVEDQHVDPCDQALKLLLGDVDPEIHRVGDHEVGTGQLIEHVVLKGGRDVAEQNHSGRLVGLREIWGEVLEDIQLHRARLSLVHVPHVFPGPAEGLSGDYLKAREIDVPPLEEFDVLLREILADDADKIHGGEEAGRHGGVGCGAAQKVSAFIKRGLDRVESDGTENE